ncbi:MAG TPA: fibronectin type III domain-containing protein [Candidatus Dormibacteraeota bacterium]|nr:fibronectin type III domain-containing protein [Candidatus Dormibacteraeota bacterium]
MALAAASALVVGGLGALTPRNVQAAVVPGTACSVFPSDNIWNTDISNMPVNTNSATWVASTTPGSGKTHPDFGGPPYGIPFNIATNATPTRSFTFQYAGESDSGPYPVPPGAQIEQGSDAHLLVINSDTCKLYETFATDLSTNSAGSGAIFDLNSDQLRPAGWTSADAAGLPIFPGLLRVDEVQAGFIGHAIRFTVHNTDNQYLWPARHIAGINNPNLPPMGARFRLKAGFTCSTCGAAAQVVLTAFKHYGLIVADNGSDWFFQGTEDSQWNAGPFPTMIQDLKGIPVNAFEAIDESSLMVSANSAQAGTAPAAPAAPVAAPRDAAATVSWTPPATGGQPIVSYTISGTPSGHAVVGGTSTTAVVFGLTNGTSYTFTVTATNVIGTGPPSPASNAVIPDHRLTGQSAPAPIGTRSGANQSGTGTPGPRLPNRPQHAAASPPIGALPRISFLRL